MPNKDLIIIGTGPAGYSAAIYSSRYKLDTALIGEDLGGLLLYTDIIENFPGFASIKGNQLAKRFKEHVEKFNVEIIEKRVINIIQDGKNFKIITADDEALSTKALILATGTTRRQLGVPGEVEGLGSGVSYCATCDAPFFKNRICCVIGGSDSAAKEALVLSRVAKKVHVIYRRSRLRAEPLLAEKVYNTSNIKVIHDANVKEICVNDSGIVESVKLDDGKIIKTHGVFIEIGFNPRSDLAKKLGVKLNERNEIVIDNCGRTNIPGVFAAGDVTNAELKQVITAAGDGARAAWAAYQYIQLEYNRS
ncbi:MAG: NAD(P)/FAD-dependent oxidoreductase [Promethearchaeota archaeon]